MEKATRKQHRNRAGLFKFLGQINMTARKACVLNTLALCEEADVMMSDLREYVGISPAGITGLVDALEAEDLVERTDHPEDRRVQLIRLTEKGHCLANSIATIWNN